MPRSVCNDHNQPFDWKLIRIFSYEYWKPKIVEELKNELTDKAYVVVWCSCGLNWGCPEYLSLVLPTNTSRRSTWKLWWRPKQWNSMMCLILIFRRMLKWLNVPSKRSNNKANHTNWAHDAPGVWAIAICVCQTRPRLTMDSAWTISQLQELGMLVRFAIETKAKSVEDLKKFTGGNTRNNLNSATNICTRGYPEMESYRFDKTKSAAGKLVFTRICSSGDKSLGSRPTVQQPRKETPSKNTKRPSRVVAKARRSKRVRKTSVRGNLKD